jgi:WD40 repeat protein
MEAKLNATDIANLISDYNYLKEDRAIQSVKRAMQLSTSALSRDKNQFSCQIYGRLIKNKEPSIKKLLVQIKKEAQGHWIRPLNSCLISTESSLIQAIIASPYCINDLAVTSDGQKILSVSEDGALKIWDVNSGHEVKAIQAHDDLANSIDITQNGKMAVSGSDDKTVRLWDLESGIRLRTLIGHSSPINVVAFFQKGDKVVSGSSDGVLKIWDARNGLELKTLKGHEESINSIIIAKNGALIISASNDAIKIWDANRYNELMTIGDGDSRWTSIALFPDEKHIVSASQDNSLTIWDLSNGEKNGTYAKKDDSKNEQVVCYKGRYCIGKHFMTDLAVTKDGSKIIIAFSNGVLEALSTDSSIESSPIEGYIKGFHDSGINTMISDPNKDKIFTGSCEGVIRVWDLKSDKGFSFPDYYSGPIATLAIAPDNQKVVSATTSGSLIIWDLEKFKKLKTLDCSGIIDLETEGEINGVRYKVISSAVIVPGERVAFSYCNSIRIFDLRNEIELRTLDGHESDILSIVVSPNGDKIISADCDGIVKVWNIESGYELRTFECQMDDIDAAAISQMGDKVIFASDKLIKIFGLENGRELITSEGDGRIFHALAFSLDGLKAISGSSDGEIKIWDLRKNKLSRAFIGHKQWIEAVSITTDGKLAISASHDGILKVWDLLDFKELAAFQGDSSFSSCAVAPDNVTIIAGDNSGRIYFLRLES